MKAYDEVYLKGCIGLQTKVGTSLCARGMMCPKCESRRAQNRGNQLRRKLEAELVIAEESGWRRPDVGVLTMTLPGKRHWVRKASLAEQYDYITERVTLPKETGWHSMRGLNKLLSNLGVHGGCHNIEFTWNEEKGWWNTHVHSLVIGYGLRDYVTPEGEEYVGPFTKAGLPETTKIQDDIEAVGWEQKHVTGRSNWRLDRLGFGSRYSLDWAEPHEYASMVKYSAKVAYMTKPVKAPKNKRGELVRFFLNSPRLSRPIGDWRRTFYVPSPDE